MKRYFFTALVIFFGCASVDARSPQMHKPPHPQDFSKDKYSLENEGEHFKGRHPAEMKGGMRRGDHRSHRVPNFHKDKRPEGEFPAEMKEKGLREHSDFHRKKLERPLSRADKRGKWEGRKHYRPNF